jgi:hypothetical protein
MVDGVDIGVFSPSGRVIAQPIIPMTTGYWQLALTPGEFPVELASVYALARRPVCDRISNSEGSRAQCNIRVRAFAHRVVGNP